MKWPMEKLGVVAPAKPIKKPKIADPNSVWLLNLDMVESHTGRVIEKLFCSADEAGTSTHWFDENYVLYSKLRPYLNKVVVPDGLGLATTELVPMLPDPERLDRKYLAYYLRSEQFVRWVNEQVAGAKMPRVSMKIFWEHEIPLPPLEEQKRIVAILDKADAIRQKRQQAIALADDFLRSVFLDMFGDPVANPKRWPTKKLGKIVDCINGDRSSNYPSGNDIVDSGIIFLSTKNITNGQLDLSFTQYITLEKFKSLSRGKLQKNDIVITLRGTLAQSAIFDTDLDTGFINAQLMILRCSNDISPIFLHALLMSNSFNSYLKSIGNGAAVPQLTASQIKNIDIYIPPKAEQEKYIEITSAVSVIEKKQNKKLSNNILNTLAQKAFLGQL